MNPFPNHAISNIRLQRRARLSSASRTKKLLIELEQVIKHVAAAVTFVLQLAVEAWRQLNLFVRQVACVLG